MYRKYKNWITYMAQTGTRSVRGEINIQGRATIPLALPLDKTFSEDINKYSPYRVKKYSGPEWSSVDRGRRLLFWDFISILAWVGQHTCRFSSSAALSNHSFVHPSSFFHLSISRLCGAWMTQNHNKACHRHAGPLCTFYTLPLQSVKCMDAEVTLSWSTSSGGFQANMQIIIVFWHQIALWKTVNVGHVYSFISLLNWVLRSVQQYQAWTKYAVHLEYAITKEIINNLVVKANTSEVHCLFLFRGFIHKMILAICQNKVYEWVHNSEHTSMLQD